MDRSGEAKAVSVSPGPLSQSSGPEQWQQPRLTEKTRAEKLGNTHFLWKPFPWAEMVAKKAGSFNKKNMRGEGSSKTEVCLLRDVEPDQRAWGTRNC